jgi:hypothetical protein
MSSARWLATAVAVALPVFAGSALEASPAKPVPNVSPEACALLDNRETAGRLDGLLYFLAKACNREMEFLGTVFQSAPEGEERAVAATDAAVSNPATDTSGTAKTQSETSIAVNPVTGVLCAAYNDSFHGVTQGTGFSGYSRSTNDGATWTDFNALSSDDSGDPSLVWRKLDGKFYYASLRNGGLGLYRSDDDCQSFVFVSQIATGNDDKEIMAVDNNVSSPFYGRLYVTWTDFGQSGRIFGTFSSNAGATWSSQVALSVNTSVQGSWPVVAANGDIFVAWIAWLGAGFPDGNLEVQVARSTDGGASYTLVTPPMTNKVNPREATSTSVCGRPALRGNIRYLPSPQIAIDGSGTLHAVYTYDPDAVNSGDVVNVYYRRSLDNGATWQTEIKVNDDATTTDQYQPSMSVGEGNVVTIGYYSRQNDANNLLLDYYSRTSYDAGASFAPSVRLSDVSSPVVLDVNLASCYHGDYDTQIHHGGMARYLWSDDRGGNPDVYYDSTPAGTDFLVLSSPPGLQVCAPNDAVYSLDVLQFNAFNEAVTLSVSGNPGSTTVGFSPNPVNPGNSSTLTVGNTGSAGLSSSTLTITGTSSPSSIVHAISVGLDVFPAAPGTSTLTAPADGATLQPLRPTFTWNAVSGATTYELEVDDDASFATPVYTANVAGTTHQPATDLPSNEQLFWRVRASNICGDGGNSAVFDFTTLPLPGDCPVGATADQQQYQSFEAGAPGWSTAGGIGSSWAASTARAHAGASSMKATTPAIISDQRLTSPSITLPTGPGPISMMFWQWQTIESQGADRCWDGAIVEISTNGGASFTQLTTQLQADFYDGPVGTGFNNPLDNLNAWCGDPDDWTRAVVDVTAFAGQTVQFRFRIGTDSSQAREGWYIDEFQIQNCAGAELFEDGFESGDASEWWAAVP